MARSMGLRNIMRYSKASEPRKKELDLSQFDETYHFERIKKSKKKGR